MMSVLDLKKKYMTTNSYIEIEEIRPKYKIANMEIIWSLGL